MRETAGHARKAKKRKQGIVVGKKKDKKETG